MVLKGIDLTINQGEIFGLIGPSGVGKSSLINMLQSNVNMETEMTDLIMAQRAFQFNSKAMQATDEMWGMINNLRGK